MHIKHLQKNLELECLNCGKKTCRKVSHHQCLLPFEIEYCNNRPCNDEHGKLKLKLCRACTVLMLPSAYFLMLYIYVLYSCSWIVCVDILAAIIYSSDFKRSLPLSPEPEGRELQIAAESPHYNILCFFSMSSSSNLATYL